MNTKSNAAALIALVLASSAKAAFLDDILAGPGTTPQALPPNPLIPIGTSTSSVDPTTPTATPNPTTPSVVPPVNPPANTTVPVAPVVPVLPTSSALTPDKPKTTSTTITTASTTLSLTPTPTPSGASTKESTSNNKLATAGIVVGAVVVAAAIGIWVFRKWKLSPSRDFQSKIRGDDYADNDYPRSYENDTVRLHHMGDQPAEPANAKSAYNAQTAFPQEDQYYDANYASKDQSGYGQSGYNNNEYGHANAPGYEQGGYNNGYNDNNNYAQSQAGGYGHDGYAQSQVGGGGYGGNQGAYNQGGYAPSQAGGGYQQHGYDDYGRR